MIKTRTISEIWDEVFKKESRGSQAVVKSGIEMLDRAVCIQNGDFILISAPYSSGKTTLLLSYMDQALSDGKRVDLLFFNEMNHDLITRLVAFEEGIPTDTIYEHTDELPRLAESVLSQEKYTNLKIIEGSHTDEEIIEYIQENKDRDLLLVDNMEFILDASVFGKAATCEDIKKRLENLKGGEEKHTIMNLRDDRVAIDPENDYLTIFVLKIKGLGEAQGFATIGTIKHSQLPRCRVPQHKAKIEDLRKYGALGNAVDSVIFPCVCSASNSYFCRDPEDFDDEKAALFICNSQTLENSMIPAVWDGDVVRFKNCDYEPKVGMDMPDSFFEIDEEINF